MGRRHAVFAGLIGCSEIFFKCWYDVDGASTIHVFDIIGDNERPGVMSYSQNNKLSKNGRKLENICIESHPCIDNYSHKFTSPSTKKRIPPELMSDMN